MLKVGKDSSRFYDYPLAFLRNLRVDNDANDKNPDLFADALILITNGAQKKDLEYLYQVQLEDPNELLENGDFTRQSDVDQYLNGYGRVQYFTVLKSDPETGDFNPLMKDQTNIVTRIEEGHFKNGKLDGFGRVLAEDGHHEIGFWKEGQPYGKLQKYRGGVLLQ